MVQRTVIFSANRGYALSSSRKDLIERFLMSGWQVVLATAADEESWVLVDSGAILEPIVFNRGGFAPQADWRAYKKLCGLLRKYSPSLVHFFHAKPVILGTLAARRELKDSVRVVNTITGLGHAFIKGGLVAYLASTGYRHALPKADITIFQNQDDRRLFLEKGCLLEAKARLVAGSGVPLDRFLYVERSGRDNTRPVVVMLCRLLNQKGIPEFTQIARRVCAEIPGARFCLAGEEDPGHPDAVDMDWLRREPTVEYLGRLGDVKPLLEEADLLLFPSYYREGVPRVVMEAAATGLPTVAFDVPGVREAVQDGKTGYLIADRDVEAMTARVLSLLQDEPLRLELGRQGHELAKELFDIKTIQEDYLRVYRELGMSI